MATCHVCKKTKENVIPIFKPGTSCGDESNYYKECRYICEGCLQCSEEYGLCGFCGRVGAYHFKNLYEDEPCVHTCKEHRGEAEHLDYDD